MRFILAFLISFSAIAGVPVDVVFDIDLTIVANIPESGKDPLRDPADPRRGTVDIQFTDEGVAKAERYRVFEGMTDLMAKLKADPRVRVSFFSGGTEARNESLLREIKLPDGTSLWDLAQGRVYGRTSMTATGKGSMHRIRDRFKKDLTRINPDLSDVIIIDDIKEFVPDSQTGHMLWIGEDFPYPERSHILTRVTPDLLARERNKYRWISSKLELALSERFRTGKPLSTLIQELTVNRTVTPFSRGLGGPGCSPDEILGRLLQTLRN